MSVSYPSLKIWFITLGLFGAIGIATLIIAPKKREYIFRKSIEYAFSSSERDNKKKKVVFLGSSLLRCALSDEPAMRLLQQGERSFEIVKIGVATATLEDFLSNKYFIRKVSEYQPDYLLIQESILHRKKRSLNLKSVLSRKELIDVINGKYSLFKEEWMMNTTTLDIIQDSIASVEALKLSKIDYESNMNLLIDFLGVEEEVSVMIVKVPIPWKLEKARNELLNSTEYTLARTSLEKSHDVKYLNFDQRFHYKYFFDKLHLNDIGERVYTQWFLEQMAHIIEKDSSANE